MISAGTVILILWITIALLVGWAIYQSRVIYRLEHPDEFRKKRKQDNCENNPQSRID